MQPLAKIPCVDNNTTLPDSLFPPKERAWCTMFVQDAKFTRTGIKTCEFGTALSSQWSAGIHDRPWKKAVQVLNAHGTRVWLMCTPEQRLDNNEREGDQAVWPKVHAAIKQSARNIPSLVDPARQRRFPTRYEKANEFDPRDLATYYAVGMSPYADLPAEHFANISGEYPKQPRILMMDDGITGPVPCVTNYKHITRLVLNGTAAAQQNPDFVVIELEYRPDLAAWLLAKFPDSQRLVLKAVASARGEGVLMLDASTEATLDADLKQHLSDNSPFHAFSVLSVCIIEDFVYAPEQPSADRMNETLVRVAHLALQTNGKVELHSVSATRRFEDPKSHKSKHSHGMVKVGRNNDGRYEQFTHEQLEELRDRQFTAISSFAQRAINYDRQAAIAYFLSSAEHVMNLIGLELLNPRLTYSYRERVEAQQPFPVYTRVTAEQCSVCLTLLQRNKSESVRRLILQNILLPELQGYMQAPHRQEPRDLAALLRCIVDEEPKGKVAALCHLALAENYKNMHRGFSMHADTMTFMVTGLELFSRFSALEHRIDAMAFVNVMQILPFVMAYDEKTDYAAKIKRFRLNGLSAEHLQAIRAAVRRHTAAENRIDYNIYRYLHRLEHQEKVVDGSWTAADWEALTAALNSNALSMLWMLPEAQRLGWSPKHVATLVNMFYALAGADDAFDFFGPYPRLFAQCKGINGQLAYSFCITLAKFEVAPLLLIQLHRHMIDRILIREELVNEALTSVLRGLLATGQAHGNSTEALHHFIQRLTGD